MDISKIKLFAAMQNKMNYLGERQSVLARNVANANTPGYKPLDLKKVDFGDMVSSYNSHSSLTTTHPMHMSLGSSSGGNFQQEKQIDAFEVTPSGNAVVLEEQMLKMSENALDYQATTRLYKKMTSLMNTAIGGN